MAALTTTHRNNLLGSLHRHPRRVTKRGGLLAVLISITALVLMPQPAFGHASSVGSSPAADAVLDTAPSEVRIDFDSGLLEMGAALIVRSADGSSVTTGPAVPVVLRQQSQSLRRSRPKARACPSSGSSSAE